MSLHDSGNILTIKTTIKKKCLPAYNTELTLKKLTYTSNVEKLSPKSSSSTCRHVVRSHVVMFTRMHSPAIYGAKSQTTKDRPLPEQLEFSNEEADAEDETKKRKISLCGSRHCKIKYLELDHFILLFFRGRQRNEPRFKTHKHSHSSAH